MRKLLTLLSLMMLSGLPAAFAATPAAPAAAAKTYDVCWSHYTGWEPWAYADEKGLLKKWGAKYGINIRLTLVNDYVESVNLYTAGKYQACAMTNMDALTIPAVGGVDSTVLIIGDFSNGNDGIVTKSGKTVKELKGQKIKLVQLSVSHYLLSRALAMNGMTEKDVTLVNTSDADIGSLFLAEKTGAAVTWNPILLKVRTGKGVSMVFDSSKIPGEIIDMMVVRTDAPDTLKKALTGAWFETMSIMSGTDKPAKDAIALMAAKAGGTVAEFEAQLKATSMFYKSADAAAFAKTPKLRDTMEFVRTFSFEKGLFGKGARTKDAVGISFADGSTLGNPKNVKLRFDATYMQLAADGKL
jgi:NitT/TauT family transport system substrate-binding protein